MPVSFNAILCDNDADKFDAHFDLQISGQDILQSTPVIRSAEMFSKGRGNSVYTISFKARKRHATVAAAESYCATHVKGTRGEAAFSGFGMGLAAATCQTTVAHVGVTTIASYTITGSEAPG